jgi:hypothetical protein
MGIRICLTDEDIKRDAIPVSNDGKCTSKIKSRSSNRWVIAHSCTEPVSSGEAEVNFESAKAYSVKAKGTMTQGGQTKPYEMSMRMQHVSTGLRQCEAGLAIGQAISATASTTSAAHETDAEDAAAPGAVKLGRTPCCYRKQKREPWLPFLLFARAR